jgi:hypothetical protein
VGSIFLSITTNLLQFASCLRKLSKIFYREVSLCRNPTRAEIQPSRPINREGDGGKEKRNRSQEQRPGVARHFWPQGRSQKASSHRIRHVRIGDPAGTRPRAECLSPPQPRRGPPPPPSTPPPLRPLSISPCRVAAINTSCRRLLPSHLQRQVHTDTHTHTHTHTQAHCIRQTFAHAPL